MAKSFGTIASIILSGIFLVANAVTSVSAQNNDLLVISGGTLIDPASDDPGGVGTIIVQNGLIISVRPGDNSPLPSGAQVIDASGGFVIPGIADMHNHLGSGLFRDDDDRARVLRSLLDWGVTTTLDPGVPADKFDALRNEVSRDRGAYPRAFLVKGVFTSDGGLLEGYTPGNPITARTFVQKLKAAGSVGVKLVYDDMRWATTRPYPVMDREIAVALIDEADRLGLISFAHAPIQELAKHMLEAGVDCLVHGIVSEPVDAEFIDLMKRNNTCYISTLTMFQTKAGYGELADRFEELDLNKRLNPKAMALFRNTPTGTARLDNSAWTAERLPVLRLNLFIVHGAGIPVVIGTDAGRPGVLPGISAQLEMVMHQEAGLDPIDVLRAATSVPGKVFATQGVFGTLSRGAQADLLVLDADPRDDIGNVRRIRHVIRAGRLHK